MREVSQSRTVGMAPGWLCQVTEGVVLNLIHFNYVRKPIQLSFKLKFNHDNRGIL